LALFLSAASVCIACAEPEQIKHSPTSGPANVEAIINDAVARLWKQTDKHWHEGEYRHIVNLARVIVHARPDMMDAYLTGGWLLWSMDEDDQAVELYELGLKANPESYVIYDELGFYYFNRKKDYTRAIPYYEKAVTFKECQPFTIHMLAHSYERTKQTDKALKAWERAAAIPENQIGKMNLERFKRKMNQN
jgi:tetratricopeptide (TPR) repeat protein